MLKLTFLSEIVLAWGQQGRAFLPPNEWTLLSGVGYDRAWCLAGQMTAAEEFSRQKVTYKAQYKSLPFLK